MRRVRYAAVFAIPLLLVVLMIPTLLRQLTNAFLFHPVSGQSRTPEAVGLAFEEVTLVAEDGVRTQAWWIPWAGDPDLSLGVSVVTFHGNAGTMSDRLEHTRWLHDLGVSVLTAEYRGYGGSEGRPTEQGLAADALAALAELRRRAPGDRLVAHGRSLGGAVAIRLAADATVHGLVVESTFTRLADMAARSGIPLASHLIAYEFDSLARVSELQIPLLIVHGQADELIPVTMSHELRDAAGGPVELLEVAGGTHNDTWVRAGDAYWNRLEGWLKTVALRSPP